MWYGYNHLITDNTIANCTDGGIYSYYISDASIERNTLMNTGTHGIHLHNPSRSKIAENNSSHPTDRAYFSYSYYSNPADGNTFTNNTASNARNYGFHIQENNPTITHNTAWYINQFQGYYISCHTTCTGGTISNNYAAYSYSGYNLNVDDMTIEGNTAEYSRAYGFYLFGDNNDFMNNIARYNKTELGAICAGFDIEGGGNNVNSNLAEMNNTNGLLVNSTGGVNTVTGNTVRDNFRNGLVLDNAGGSSDVTNNIVTNNEGEGIANHNGTVNTMTGNTATGNRVGADICNDGTITTFTGNTHTSGGSGTPCTGL
jgi:parallel beta-helix repeat protein